MKKTTSAVILALKLTGSDVIQVNANEFSIVSTRAPK